MYLTLLLLLPHCCSAGFAVRIVRTNVTNPVRNISIVPAAEEASFADSPYQASFLELVKGAGSSSSSSSSGSSKQQMWCLQLVSLKTSAESAPYFPLCIVLVVAHQRLCWRDLEHHNILITSPRSLTQLQALMCCVVPGGGMFEMLHTSLQATHTVDLPAFVCFLRTFRF
jgi:hypothetical protein